ncbi:MAG: aminoacyl-tRNA hydrolase [Mariprofundaceae bacterium]|nr:aminoacyl-tRNA hydrolase [Mariprofundaceae bacterium]
MLMILEKLCVSDDEVQMTAVRAQGAGGQHVNKVSSAIHLRFDIQASSLPDECKDRLLQYNDARITSAGVVVIKAQQFRSQDMNREDALKRLKDLLEAGLATQKKRKAMRRSKASIQKRLAGKNHRSHIKTLRKRVSDE